MRLSRIPISIVMVDIFLSLYSHNYSRSKCIISDLIKLFITGSNLLKLAEGFIREIDEQLISHIIAIIVSFIPCWKLTGLIQPSHRTRSTCIPSDTEHVFGIVVVTKTATLSTNAFSRDTNLGGKLLMRSMTDFVIDGTIDQSSKGYEYGRGKGFTGGSVSCGPKKSQSNNKGGGGPGSSAGYGTKGGGKYGGDVYGMKE